jgi:hypothetical protein
MAGRRSSVAWVARDFLAFLRQNRKWWLLPLLLVLGLLALLLVAGATPIAPFIYTLF